MSKIDEFLKRGLKGEDTKLSNIEFVNFSIELAELNKYKLMWYNLKKSINRDLEYHKAGVMQSLAESVHGEAKCEEFITRMEEIEKQFRI